MQFVCQNTLTIFRNVSLWSSVWPKFYRKVLSQKFIEFQFPSKYRLHSIAERNRKIPARISEFAICSTTKFITVAASVLNFCSAHCSISYRFVKYRSGTFRGKRPAARYRMYPNGLVIRDRRGTRAFRWKEQFMTCRKVALLNSARLPWPPGRKWSSDSDVQPWIRCFRAAGRIARFTCPNFIALPSRLHIERPLVIWITPGTVRRHCSQNFDPLQLQAQASSKVLVHFISAEIVPLYVHLLLGWDCHLFINQIILHKFTTIRDTLKRRTKPANRFEIPTESYVHGCSASKWQFVSAFSHGKIAKLFQISLNSAWIVAAIQTKPFPGWRGEAVKLEISQSTRRQSGCNCARTSSEAHVARYKHRAFAIYTRECKAKERRLVRTVQPLFPPLLPSRFSFGAFILSAS